MTTWTNIFGSFHFFQGGKETKTEYLSVAGRGVKIPSQFTVSSRGIANSLSNSGTSIAYKISATVEQMI